ncbi:MAG: hypothetical protein KAS38_21655 [Anaerolineales bacterium]|nr:hypothetical protein [Anaerolineales bacterium]
MTEKSHIECDYDIQVPLRELLSAAAEDKAFYWNRSRRAQDVGGVGGSSKALISSEDAAERGADVDSRALNAALLVYNLDLSLASWVEMELWRYVLELSSLEGWREVKKDKALKVGEHMAPRVLARIALLDCIYPVKYPAGGVWRMKAAALGVSKWQYLDVWKSRLDAITTELRRWVEDGHLECGVDGHAALSIGEVKF